MADAPDIKAMQTYTAEALKAEGAFQRIQTSSEATAVIQTRVADQLESKADLLTKLASMTDAAQKLELSQQKEILENVNAEIDLQERKGELTALQATDARKKADADAEALADIQSMGTVTPQMATDWNKAAIGARSVADAAANTAAIVQGSNKGISETLTMMTNVSGQWRNTGVGAFFVTAKAEGFGAALGKVKSEAKELFTASNMLGSSLLQLGLALGKMVFALADARAEFNKSSGAGGRYNDAMDATSEQVLAMGGKFSDQGDILSANRNNLSSWSDMSQEARDSAEAHSLAMSQLGVDFETTAKSQENMMSVMQLTQGESQQFQANLHALSDSLEMDFSVLMDNMATHFERFAGYGKDAGKEFMRMQGIAKKLGVEMGVLLDITEQYDTISGAAAATAKLNAALGGRYLSASGMMNKSLSERVIAIRGAIDASGKDFSTMTRSEKQYYANALGIKDLTAATKIFGTMSAEEMAQVARDAEKAGQTIDEFVKATEASKSPGAKFQQLLSSLATLAAPLVTLLTYIVDALLWMDKALKKVTGGYVGLVPALLTVFMIWKGWTMLSAWAGTIFEGLGSSVVKQGKDTAKSGKSMAKGIKSVGDAASKSAKGLLTLGLTFIMIGIGIAIIVLSLAVLASQMKDMSGGQMIAFAVVILAIAAAIWIMVPAIFGLAPASTAAAVPMLLFGVAMLLVGAGVALAGFGLWLFVQAFLAVADQLPAFAMFVGLMALLAVASLLVGIGGLFAMIGLVMMSVGLIALAFALFWISTDDLEALGQMMQGLGKVAEFAGAGMGDAVPAVKSLMYTLLGFTKWPFAGSGNIRDGMFMLGLGFMFMGSGAKTAKDILPGLVSPMAAIADAVNKWAEAQAKLMQHFPKFVLLMAGLAMALMAVGWAFWGILAVVAMAYGLSDALASIPEGKVETFTQMFKTIEEAGPAVQKITPAVVDNVTALVEQAHEYSSAVRFDGIDRFAEMMRGAFGGGSEGKTKGAGGEAGPQTIILEIDGNELGRINDKLKDKRAHLTLKG